MHYKEKNRRKRILNVNYTINNLQYDIKSLAPSHRDRASYYFREYLNIKQKSSIESCPKAETNRHCYSIFPWHF